MEIRSMRLDDYDSVYALWLSCPGMGLNSIDDSREGIGRYLTRNPHTSFVAVEQDRIVGAILAGHDGRRGHISHTAVALEYQRQGIGEKLVEAAFARNENGNAFWEKMGFTERTDLIYRNRALVDMERIDT